MPGNLGPKGGTGPQGVQGTAGIGKTIGRVLYSQQLLSVLAMFVCAFLIKPRLSSDNSLILKTTYWNNTVLLTRSDRSNRSYWSPGLVWRK